jgi:branched-chain amino acid transport system permease protein
MFSVDLIFEAVLFGILLGCFYAAVSLGLSVAFGLLDVPYVAHPALLVLGSYFTYALCQTGIDPILCGLLLMPVFYLIGIAFYRFYYETFEKRSTDTGVRGLAFFFGMAFIIEVCLILVFGVDQRTVSASYIGSSLEIGDYRLPYRMLVAFVIALSLTFVMTIYFSQDLQRPRHQSSWAR